MPAYSGESAGLDLYYTGKEDIILSYRNPSKLIPTGLRIALPKGKVALLRERGSIIKTPLFLRAGVIDPGYTGEIFVNLVYYPSIGDFLIEPNQKLPVQLIVTSFDYNFVQVNEQDWQMLTTSSIRKEGKIGSTN